MENWVAPLVLESHELVSRALQQKWIPNVWRHSNPMIRHSPSLYIEVASTWSRPNTHRAEFEPLKAWSLFCKSHTPSIDSPAANNQKSWSQLDWGCHTNRLTQIRDVPERSRSVLQICHTSSFTPRIFHDFLYFCLDRRNSHICIQTHEPDDLCHWNPGHSPGKRKEGLAAAFTTTWCEWQELKLQKRRKARDERRTHVSSSFAFTARLVKNASYTHEHRTEENTVICTMRTVALPVSKPWSVRIYPYLTSLVEFEKHKDTWVAGNEKARRY